MLTDMTYLHATTISGSEYGAAAAVAGGVRHASSKARRQSSFSKGKAFILMYN